MLTLSPKMAQLLYFKHNKNFSQKSKSHFYSLLTDCNQEQFCKNLMKIFSEKFKSVTLEKYFS